MIYSLATSSPPISDHFTSGIFATTIFFTVLSIYLVMLSALSPLMRIFWTCPQGNGLLISLILARFYFGYLSE